MALLHPAPATSLPTCHHRQNAGVLIQQPSRRRFRLNAQRKPGSTSTSPRTGTPSGSESDNVVLKAAWYGSEALGIAASFFRPPSPEADAGAADDGTSESQPVGRAQVAEAIKDDFARSYFVTGNLTLGAYEDDCEFADPAGSFRGLQRFKRNCTNFGSLLEKSNMKLTKWEDVEVHFPRQSIDLYSSEVVSCFRRLIDFAGSGCRTNRSGTGVSAASCRSRGGPFSPVSSRLRALYLYQQTDTAFGPAGAKLQNASLLY
ncbi:hypothetical protein CFC21_024750 [Triticum aestivum]|uniref:Uncharacterized protein n=2 Tax=Triticum aestivum TaxID=4565 RepID=A0A3B6CAJ0_WHEAT|nr:hypothetical protein CFC21_024750 [Triticum aestivum]